MNNTGWVCLHRSLLQWEWWDEPNTTRLFIYCLLKANHSQQKWRGITVEAGQFIFGIQQCKNESSMSTQSIRTSMNRLISTGSLTRQVTSRHSLITVVNWAKFQVANRLANTLLTGNQQAANNQVTGNQPQTTMYNNDNNVKNETTSTIVDVGEVQKIEPSPDPAPSSRMKMFIEDVRNGGPMTNATIKYLYQQSSIEPSEIRSEITKFVDYWTEPNHTGKKQRWQLQPTFDVKRRLITWLGKYSQQQGGRAGAGGGGNNWWEQPRSGTI